MKRGNLAARAGRWSVNHRKKAILGWLAFVVLALGIAMAAPLQILKTDELGIGESGRADKIVSDGYPKSASEHVLVQSTTDKARSTEFRAVVADVEKRLDARPEVANLDSPQLSKDGRSALLSFELKGDEVKTAQDVDAVLAVTKAAQAAHNDYRIVQSGDASIVKDLDKIIGQDFAKAETISFPLTFVILLVALGTLLTAGLPLLTGITSVLATFGLVSGLSQVLPMTQTVQSVVLLIGLAVGVDYALFYIRRVREERAAGRDKDEAVLAAAATSGRTVLISGMTVIIAMAGMFFTGSKDFASLAIGSIVVVAVSMLSSVTVLPALLSKLGDRIDGGKRRRRRIARRGKDSRMWSAILDRVMRRPLVSAVVAAGVLVAMSVPALGLQTSDTSIDDLPRDGAPAMQAYDRIQAAYPGQQIAATVVVKAKDVTAPKVKAAIGELRAQAAATGKLHEPATIDVSPNRTVARVSLPIQGDGNDAASKEALETLREDVVPATIGRVPATEALVTGFTAQSVDSNTLMRTHAPYVFAFVLGLAFLLLMITFRSVVIPIKAIVLNLLSVGAAYGVLVQVFQHGWGADLIGLEHTGPIVSWLPLFLFTVLFGLSMDYHVFILSRVREAFDRGMSTEDAVSHGIKATAGTVTSAAVVMIGVFGVFVGLSEMELKQAGVGLSVAVLIDATIVRAVLLPATMKLLGDRNWYLPRKLRWLPKLKHEGEVVPEPA
jgi:uncharacterized membrane protein YdfJ with MMPL/SSD domain